MHRFPNVPFFSQRRVKELFSKLRLGIHPLFNSRGTAFIEKKEEVMDYGGCPTHTVRDSGKHVINPQQSWRLGDPGYLCHQSDPNQQKIKHQYS